MRKTRIFVDDALKSGDHITLSAVSSHYLTRVLRLGVGDGCTLLNDSGFEFSAQILIPKHSGAVLEIGASDAVNAESNLRITLEQALLRSEKMSLVLQKSCELGVAAVHPILSERTEVRLSDEREEKRLRHWREVLISAIEQCGRTRLPGLAAPRKLHELKPCAAGEIGLLLDPGATLRLRDLRPESTLFRVAVGPEGGFTEAELKWLQRLGYRRLRMGPRVLRTETAGPAVIAALQALYGDA